MSGSAALLLITIEADTWVKLKTQLIEEFDRKLDRHDVYIQLTQRKLKKDEPIRHYILSMQALAEYADIDERELVRFIIEGLEDRSAAVAMLYSAKNLAELKNLSADYERYRMRNPKNSYVKPPKVTVPPRSLVATPSSSSMNDNTRLPSEPIRCYNCRQFAHIASSCPKPKRPLDGCYRCFEVGHQHSSCPKGRKPVAAVTQLPDEAALSLIDLNSDNDLSDEMAALQMVSVAFEFAYKAGPANFIQRSAVPSVLCANEKFISTECKGLGGVKLDAVGILECTIKFRLKTHRVNIFVLADEVLPVPLLLGREFLNVFGIGLQFIAP